MINLQISFCSSDDTCFDLTQVEELFINNIIEIGATFDFKTFDYQNHNIINSNFGLFTLMSIEQLPLIMMSFSYISSHIDYGYPWRLK